MTLRIIGRREDDRGRNTHFKLGDGRTVTLAEAVAMVKSGNLPGYHIYERDGIEYLRDNPDKRESDNIDNQPLI